MAESPTPISPPSNHLWHLRTEQLRERCAVLSARWADSQKGPWQAGKDWDKTGLFPDKNGIALFHERTLYWFLIHNTQFVQFRRFPDPYDNGFGGTIPDLAGADVVSNGKLVVSEGNLYFIKLRNVANQGGKVEIHRWRGPEFQHKDMAEPTGFSIDLAEKGQWTIRGSSLVFFQTTGGGKSSSGKDSVVLHVTQHNYMNIMVSPTCFEAVVASKGDFYLTNERDIVFVRTSPASGQQIEVYLSNTTRPDTESPAGHTTAFGESGPALGYIFLDTARI